MTRAIAPHADVRHGRAETVERVGSGYRVRVEGEWIEADHVVLATEAHNAASLIGPLDARAGELLAAEPVGPRWAIKGELAELTR